MSTVAVSAGGFPLAGEGLLAVGVAAALQVAAGTTVTWTNHDAIIHSVTSGSPDAPDGAFDSGFFDQAGTFSFTFTDSGDYTYFCMRHNFMRGTVSVVPN